MQEGMGALHSTASTGLQMYNLFLHNAANEEIHSSPK